ncbi:MAG: DNA adenine methylase, partial [Gammaproteobacteria bacterium]|nr:DNA adenine methylase [Gammaproteobacteria bacterium]
MSFSPGAPKPFLKWVGGKRRLLGPLGKAVDALPSLKGYHEPFIGGGALFFALTQRAAAPTRFYLSDVNGALIDGYIAVRDDVDAVIEALERHESAHSREYFYELRATHPESRVERAARLMYLNKTCYN